MANDNWDEPPKSTCLINFTLADCGKRADYRNMTKEQIDAKVESDTFWADRIHEREELS